MSAFIRKLNKIRDLAPVIPFDATSKFIFISDCHRGLGGTGDNFAPNHLLFYGALEYYYKNGFTYIELGDGDELWENRKLKPIIEAHNDIYGLMSRMYHENRFYMLYGNHDIIKRKRLTASLNYYHYFCEEDVCVAPLFPEITVHEGLLLKNEALEQDIFLVHGHQGSFLNDSIWPIARFLVRFVWKPLEAIGVRQPWSGDMSLAATQKLENKLSLYAKNTPQMVIAGHTHRPVFPAPGNGLYFNDGSCVLPQRITGIEIENNQISFIKWAVGLKEDLSMHVTRSVLEGPFPLSAYFSAK